ncbi:hypothetical protein E2C01_070872 [Portunus trituberculatus]|uniref:Uncharacterized protein n=1 Tax=Portunus trituberculatus TaxID=210409 RepID=A0A5B7I3Q0_PORTR|nr:hypothetical protein [Portunus trituberculatus]
MKDPCPATLFATNSREGPSKLLEHAMKICGESADIPSLSPFAADARQVSRGTLNDRAAGDPSGTAT